MQASSAGHKSGAIGTNGIAYRTVCLNPGCGFKFDLRITLENASLLCESITCPHCKRHGGQLKSLGRISEKLFAAKLVFPTTRLAATRVDADEV